MQPVFEKCGSEILPGSSAREIPLAEIEFSPLSLVDNVGRVFQWKGKIYRGIYPEAAEQTQALFASGCITELSRQGLFPQSHITDFRCEGFALVVEHEAIRCATYPHEWPFDMFRDAALAILDVFQIAQRFGWILKDCHPYNILFDGTKPAYVDLGSLIPVASWNPRGFYQEFFCCYLVPLTIWASGDPFLARRIIASSEELLPTQSWHLYANPLLRRCNPAWKKRIENHWEKICTKFSRLFQEEEKKSAWKSLATWIPLEFLEGNPEWLRHRLLYLKAPTPTGIWHNYHTEYLKGPTIASTPRFDWIVEKVSSLDCTSAVELAGNQGAMSLLLAAKTPIQTVVCTDSDGWAVNHLYRFCKENPGVIQQKIITPSILNFMTPSVNFMEAAPAKRYCSHLVLALAITHHLVLASNFKISDVMRTIASYSKRYVIIDFMPLGLWDGHQAPALPAWYNQEWFEKGFTEFFEILEINPIETNRILYLGRLKLPSPR